MVIDRLKKARAHLLMNPNSCIQDRPGIFVEMLNCRRFDPHVTFFENYMQGCSIQRISLSENLTMSTGKIFYHGGTETLKHRQGQITISALERDQHIACQIATSSDRNHFRIVVWNHSPWQWLYQAQQRPYLFH